MVREKSLTSVLAQYGATLTFNKLPDDVVQHTKILILDTIGAGLWGSTLDWGNIVARMVFDFGSNPCASVWGTSTRVSPADAALVNGTFCHGFELDDIHKNALLHVGAVTVVPALAIAHKRYTKRPVSGPELIGAVAAGCEIGARVGLISGLAQLKQGYHAAARTGVFCASATVANILKLSENQFIHALGIAGSQAAGLMAAQHGAMVKRMHLGRAAQSGLYAGILAQKGFTGIDNVLDAPYGGFLSVLGVDSDIESVTANLQATYEILNVGFKPYSSCAGTHTSIDAVLELRRNYPEIRSDLIDRIEITMATVNKNHVGWFYEPGSVTAAQMNVGYCVGVALRKGHVFVESFTPEAIHDRDTIDIARRVITHSSGEYDNMGLEGRYAVQVEIILTDGKRFTTEKKYPKGSHRDPLGREAVVLKFKTLAEKVIPEKKVNLVFDLVDNLEEVEDVSRLDKMLLKE